VEGDFYTSHVPIFLDDPALAFFSHTFLSISGNFSLGGPSRTVFNNSVVSFPAPVHIRQFANLALQSSSNMTFYYSLTLDAGSLLVVGGSNVSVIGILETTNCPDIAELGDVQPCHLVRLLIRLESIFFLSLTL
jgi:hypothetical protein